MQRATSSAASVADAFCTTGTSPTRGVLPDGPVVRYELVGPAGAPLLVVLGGISAGRHVTASRLDPSPGWWQSQVGDSGQALDTRRVRVLSFDFVGGSGTGPAPVTDAGAVDAPVTTDDQADALVRVLDRIGDERVELLVGASYGGMVGLALAARHPERLGRLFTIGAAHRPHPMATAHRALQRRIVRFGLETGNRAEAVEIARGLAMTTYRSVQEFEARFASRPRPAPPPSDGRPDRVRFPVEEYLEARGRSFAERFCPRAFLRLSESIDLHDVDPADVRVPATFVAVDTDTLVPPWLVEELADGAGGPARLLRLSSDRGHDAFLTDVESVGAVLTEELREVTR